MKKNIGFILTVLVVIGVLTSCSGKSEEEKTVEAPTWTTVFDKLDKAEAELKKLSEGNKDSYDIILKYLDEADSLSLLILKDMRSKGQSFNSPEVLEMEERYNAIIDEADAVYYRVFGKYREDEEPRGNVKSQSQTVDIGDDEDDFVDPGFDLIDIGADEDDDEDWTIQIIPDEDY